MATMNNNNNNKQKQHTIRPQITNIKRPKPNLIKAKKMKSTIFIQFFSLYIFYEFGYKQQTPRQTMTNEINVFVFTTQ